MNKEFWCWDAENELQESGSWVVANSEDEAAEAYAENTLWNYDGEPDQYRVAVESLEGKVRVYIIVPEYVVTFHVHALELDDDGLRAELGL